MTAKNRSAHGEPDRRIKDKIAELGSATARQLVDATDMAESHVYSTLRKLTASRDIKVIGKAESAGRVPASVYALAGSTKPAKTPTLRPRPTDKANKGADLVGIIAEYEDLLAERMPHTEAIKEIDTKIRETIVKRSELGWE